MVGIAKCIVEDPNGGPTSLDVVTISAQSVVLDTTNDFAGSEYIDVALELSGAPRVALFAQVAGVTNGKLHLRWMHMDPSEGAALTTVIERWQAGEFDDMDVPDGDALDIFGGPVVKPKAERKGTRRITNPHDAGEDNVRAVKSRNKTVTFEAPQDEPSQGNESARRNKTVSFENTPLKNRIVIDTGSEGDEGIGQVVRPTATRRIVRPDKPATELNTDAKRQTRRVVRPTQKIDRPEDRQPAQVEKSAQKKNPQQAPAQKKGVGQDSGHNVVITSTKRFKKIDSSPSKPHKNVLGEDGKLDVGASIRNATKTVSAAELAERHDKLKVLNMSTIKALIAAAVREAIENLGQALDQKEKDSLLKEAEDSFKERLEAFKAEKKGWQAQSERLRDQLDKAQELLDKEKQREIEKDQFTVSDAGIQDLEKQFDRMLNKASKTGVNADIENAMRTMVSSLLDDEREKIAEQARKAQGDAIELLERKVKRLATSLDETEGERDQARRQAQALAAAGGGDINVQNVYDVGLGDDDSNKEAKLALLKDIFNQNQEMRDHLKAKGTKLKTRVRPRKIKVDVPSPENSEESKLDTAHAELTSVEEKRPVVEVSVVEDMNSIGDMANPDDMPWQPGATHSHEADFEDNSEEEGGVKKMAIVNKEPPRLERTKKSPKKVEEKTDEESQTSEAPEESLVDDSANPDDMPWQPAASDAVDEEDGGSGVKKMTIPTHSEPPPLKRGS